jgi:hypothetical protein
MLKYFGAAIDNQPQMYPNAGEQHSLLPDVSSCRMKFEA